jgi:hypothetical protein
MLIVLLLLASYVSPLASQIQDNSFLLEEAYNQEAGVVQHISTFARSTDASWTLGFTQEWPLGGIKHQLSYTLLLKHDGSGTGLGDAALNYRYQLIGNPTARTVMAPRLTLLLPTGSYGAGRGAGAVGFQANLPLTINPSPDLVTHWNAGITVTPSARSPDGLSATTFGRNLGASLIWLAQPRLNFLVEMLWLQEDVISGPGSTRKHETVVVGPGVRVAFDLAGDVQIVPGLAYSVGLTEGSDEDGLFVYLSVEHPFKGQ